MAVSSTSLSDKMIIKVENGTIAAGKTKYKNITYDNVASNVTDDDFFAIASSIRNLQSKTGNQILRDKSSVIANA